MFDIFDVENSQIGTEGMKILCQSKWPELQSLNLRIYYVRQDRMRSGLKDAKA